MVLATGGMVLLSGCGDRDAPPPATPAPALSEYQIGGGDRLKIVVLEYEDLEVETRVSDDGTVEMPLIGGVRVSGRSVASVKTEVTERLASDYIIDPKVSVEVVSFRPFFILGQVNRPGDFPFQPGLTIRKAAAIAGGFTRRADTDEAILVRTVDGVETRSVVAMDTVVFPGDLIEIDRRIF